MLEYQKKVSDINKIIFDLFQFIDQEFFTYFISLTAPKIWKSHLEKHEETYEKILIEEGFSKKEIEKRVLEQEHPFNDAGIIVQMTTRDLRRILESGNYENIQARRVIKTIYDDWDSLYRVELMKLLGVEIKANIWGDLRYIRQSITHHRSIGIDELKKTKIIKDFLPGQEIIFTSSIMTKIQNALEEWYTQFSLEYFSPRNIK